MIDEQIKGWDDELQLRWQMWREDVLRPLRLLYGERADFDLWFSRILTIVEQRYAERSAELRQLDQQRLLTPDWYQQADQVGYICYTDRFAGNLRGVSDKIPYLNSLGITYLHLMPLLKTREGENDGGYAVGDYRTVEPRLGTMDDLATLATHLRSEGISLCTDLACNHTAIDHEWAQRARQGETEYADYYFHFPDRTLPDQYEQTLREIFPEAKRGNFVYHADMDRWVWTTFHPYQWDLNYHNPAVFVEMLDIILMLANQGVEILRMDAVAFMWKQLGTNCENLPQAHALLQAWRGLSRLAAPALLLKAEAIVSPELVVPYFGTNEATDKECELAYHNSLMVLLWSALAERKVNLLTHSIQQLPTLPDKAAWVTYVRCHDDIGWAITDANAAGVGLDGYWHRHFLSDFYSGEFADSFARGKVFQLNMENGDRRINGSTASLAGLEIALAQGDTGKVALAIGRILLIHSMMLAYAGIPLIYMGDEIGLLNDYAYVDDPQHADDSRWLHRPMMDWREHTAGSIAERIFSRLQHLIHTRKRLNAFHATAASTAVWTQNEHIFGLLRHSPRGQILVLGNFSEQEQVISAEHLRALGFVGDLYDHLSKKKLLTMQAIELAPFQSMWLEHLKIDHG